MEYIPPTLKTGNPPFPRESYRTLSFFSQPRKKSDIRTEYLVSSEISSDGDQTTPTIKAAVRSKIAANEASCEHQRKAPEA